MNPRDEAREEIDSRWWWPWIAIALVLTAAAVASVLPDTPRELRAEPRPEVQALTPEWVDPAALPPAPPTRDDETGAEHVATF